jgi:hypothetical protein
VMRVNLSRAFTVAKDRWLRAEWLRSAAIALVCLLCASIFLDVVGKHYPVEQWLFWRVGRIWLYCIIQSAACLSTGHLIVARVLKAADRPPLEVLYLSSVFGFVVFCLLMYAGGFLGLFNGTFAVGLAGAMFGSGIGPLARTIRRWVQRWQLAVPAPRSLSSRLLGWSVFGFGVVSLIFVYLQVMTPNSINFDAAWAHLTTSQDYARHGSIVRFPADYYRSMPQLASLVHTWGWLMPGLSVADHWMMALHEEFFVLLWTLVGVAATVQWFLDARMAHTWVAFFLFPGIFIYDNNLGGAADHYLAFFAPATVLGAGRLLRDFAPANAAVLGTAAAGAVLTKYQAAFLLAPTLGIAAAGWVYWGARRWRTDVQLGTDAAWPRSRELVLSPLLTLGIFCAAVSPHFLKNWIYYNNPVYPFMQDLFTNSAPSVKDGALLVEHLFKDKLGVPQGTFGDKLESSLRLLLTFHLEPHYSFTRGVPNFGPLFVFTLPFLLFVRRSARTWFGALVALGYVMCWAMTFRVDRNLQPIVPVMASVTAALLISAWQVGLLARVGVAGLVSLSVIWGGDAWFYSGHDRIKASMDMIRGGFEGRREDRFAFRSDFTAINKRVPAGGKIVLHNARLSLGIERDILMDWPGQQGLISYRKITGPAGMYAQYRSLGVTHLLHEPARRPAETVEDDVLFIEFVHRYGVSQGRFGGYQLTALPSTPPPPDEQPYWVFAYDLPGYENGLYRLETMTTYDRFPAELKRWPKPEQASPSDPALLHQLITRARALLVNEHRSLPAPLLEASSNFERAVRYPKRFSIYIRKRSQLR